MRVEKAQALPQIAALHQNFPNPFNPSTEIRFDIPTAREVQLRVFNQLGQTVRTLVDNRMKAGTYRIKWDGKTEAGNSISSGVYFYSLEAGDFSQIRKMTLVK
jgi:flagellar hook assembly protein FlgD